MAKKVAKARGTKVKIRRPFANPSLKAKTQFYAEPQPVLPPKKLANQAALAQR